MLVSGLAWIALIAGVAGAVIGTVVGITSAMVAGGTVRKQDEVAARLVSDDLARVAALLERCLLGDVSPRQFLDATRTSGVAPPLRRWQEHAPALARRLDDENWRTLTRTLDEWPVLFDALAQASDANGWPTEQRDAIRALHREMLAATEAVCTAYAA